MPRFDVSSVGFYVLDILGRPVTAIPEGGRAAYIDEIRMTVAGTAGATAVDCATLGLSTRAVTTVGNDDMGDFLVGKMRKLGVECSLVRRAEGVPTSATILPVRPNGERPALHVPGSAAVFTVAEADIEPALDANIIHVGGTGLLKSFDGEPTVRFLARAKERGRVTTFDLIQAHRETFALIGPCLPYIDYFVPSIDEAGRMADTVDPAEAAAFFRRRGVKNCIITLGADGVYTAPETGAPFHVPAFDVAVSDTTGCGDGFTAGIIVGIAKGWDIRTSVTFATAVAAKIAMGLGSDGKLVSFDDTMNAMKTLPVKQHVRGTRGSALR